MGADQWNAIDRAAAASYMTRQAWARMIFAAGGSPAGKVKIRGQRIRRGLRLRPELWERVEAAAKGRGWPLAAYCRAVLLSAAGSREEEE